MMRGLPGANAAPDRRCTAGRSTQPFSADDQCCFSASYAPTQRGGGADMRGERSACHVFCTESTQSKRGIIVETIEDSFRSLRCKACSDVFRVRSGGRENELRVGRRCLRYIRRLFEQRSFPHCAAFSPARCLVASVTRQPHACIRSLPLPTPVLLSMSSLR